ncbi:MAG: hypothetical protein [Wendovervirus sonii]|uniref:Uncharacterized protein n=1 Tax=phage Lak_Megaphage_Sonny TaxID=3109229 RepID=A0ABZ0Z258_9CAUD|nr:MAG: hypothetical protein [phage Lak_Megaphage_Sonny]
MKNTPKKFKKPISVTNCGRIAEYMKYTNRDRLILGKVCLTYAECKYQLSHVFSDFGKFQTSETLQAASNYLSIPRNQRKYHQSLRKLYLQSKLIIELKAENAKLK